MRRALVALTLAATFAAMPATASDQLRLLVEKDLERVGFTEVDVNSLTSAQLGAIHAVANEKREGGRRGMIRSILGGQYTLRGLFG